MDEIEGGGGGGLRLGKKSSEKGGVSGEVDYKTKAGTAWSHSYLNQKPWHPLSYPNQRRKWIAEQTHANRQQRADEVAREFAQEQEFFRQTALFTKKEKEKVELMKAVSFMYVRPPGYNAESAKAAEAAEERKMLDQDNAANDPMSTASLTDTQPDKSLPKGDKKARPKDVFGRSLPTEEEFEVLKNAPRLETGMPARVKPFGIEIRNVRCVRCGAFGHQSGDRECPLKDAIMPNEESRLKRDDPLTAIMSQTETSEPLKWELKQKPGMSPPRGGFQPDDPNQQIVAEEIFDEYGGFLGGGDIPVLLSNFSAKKSKKHSKRKSEHIRRSSSKSYSESRHHRRDQSPSSSDSETDREKKRRMKSKRRKKKYDSEGGQSDTSDLERHGKRLLSSYSEEDQGRKRVAKSKHKRERRHSAVSSSSDGFDQERPGRRSLDSEDDRKRKRRAKRKHARERRRHSESSSPEGSDEKRLGNKSSCDSEDGRERSTRSKHKCKKYPMGSRRYQGADSDHHGNRSSDSEADRERMKRAKGKRKEDSHCLDRADLDRHSRWNKY